MSAFSTATDVASNDNLANGCSGKDVIYFLQTPGDSGTIRQAFLSLSRETFNPKWIKMEGVAKLAEQSRRLAKKSSSGTDEQHEEPVAKRKKLDENLSSLPILVVDSFESSDIADLESKKYKIRILSAFALLSMNPQKIGHIPRSEYPIVSTCMKKVALTLSAIRNDKDLYLDLKRKTRYMGGKYQQAIYLSTTHIVSSCWDTRKCRFFRRNNTGDNKIVMTPEWIIRSWEMREEIKDAAKELSHFKLPLFAGMNFCVTGLDNRERRRVQEFVTKNGGKYTSGLKLGSYPFDGEETQLRHQAESNKDEQTTHLIAARKSGEKYKAAMEVDSLKIVNYDWFEDSVACGWPKLEDDPKYCLRDKEVMDELLRQEREKRRQELLNCTQTFNCTNVESKKVDENQPTSITVDPAVELERLLNSNMLGDNPVFDGLSFYFCGLSTNHQLNMKKIISRLGGTVYTELVSAVTHVIIGPQMTHKDALNLNKHDLKVRFVIKINMKWILMCINEEKLVPEMIDPESIKLLNQITSTQDLPEKDLKEVGKDRALSKSDELEAKLAEMTAEGTINSRNKTKTIRSDARGFRMGAIQNDSRKLMISRKPDDSVMQPSLPVEWNSAEQ